MPDQSARSRCRFAVAAAVGVALLAPNNTSLAAANQVPAAPAAAAAVIAWGTQVPAGLPSDLADAVAVSAGRDYDLALRRDGTVVAWGANWLGQTNVPAGLTGVAAVAAGYLTSMALKADGTVVGWGAEGTQWAAPVGLANVVAIAARSRAMALKADGTVVEWGAFGYGWTTPGGPPAGLMGVKAIAAGPWHHLALKTDGTVVGWGIGDIKYTDFRSPQIVPTGLTGITAIAAGETHSLALKSDGTVVGWGGDSYGESIPPSGLNSVVAIAAGAATSIAVKSDGTVVTWGKGVGPRGATRGLTGVINVSASDSHALFLTASALPSQPTDLSVRLRGTTATITWSPPLHGGTHGIDRYIVNINGVQTPVPPTAPLRLVFSGVMPERSQSISVAAESGSGRGQPALASVQHANTRVFRPATATWHVRDRAQIPFGRPTDIPVPADYDGDGLSEIAVFRRTDGTWHVRGRAPIRFGRPGDLPVPADYNGDGVTDLALFRPSDGRWFIRDIGVVQHGAAGDVPLPADYDGDGRDELMVFRPSNGVWYGLDSYAGTPEGGYLDSGIHRMVLDRRYGTRGDVPVPGDWNGDGIVELGVFRPSTGMWFRPGFAAVRLGQRGDLPLAGDFDVDGRTDVGVFRPTNGTWYLRGIGAVRFGTFGDVPLVAGPHSHAVNW